MHMHTHIFSVHMHTKNIPSKKHYFSFMVLFYYTIIALWSITANNNSFGTEMVLSEGLGFALGLHYQKIIFTIKQKCDKLHLFYVSCIYVLHAQAFDQSDETLLLYPCLPSRCCYAVGQRIPRVIFNGNYICNFLPGHYLFFD